MISENEFWKNFKNENLHYSIFGLGNSNYEFFNNQAKKLEGIFTYFEEEKIENEKKKNEKKEEIKKNEFLNYNKFIPEYLIIYGTESGNSKKLVKNYIKIQ